MNKTLNPNIFTAVLIVFAVLILAALPVRIQIVPNEVGAQETPATTEIVRVAQTETRIVEFTLLTQLGGTPPMAFIGVGGEIEGMVNPELTVNAGDTVRLTVINGDPTLHDLRIDAFGVDTGQLLADEQTVTVEFVANQPGSFEYYCSIPGHREVGMKGLLHVVGSADDTHASDYVTTAPSQGVNTLTVSAAVEDAASVIHHPAKIPATVRSA